MNGKAGADFSTTVTKPSNALDAIAPAAVTIGAAAARADTAAARDAERVSSVATVRAEEVERIAKSVVSDAAEKEDEATEAT